MQPGSADDECIDVWMCVVYVCQPLSKDHNAGTALDARQLGSLGPASKTAGYSGQETYVLRQVAHSLQSFGKLCSSV